MRRPVALFWACLALVLSAASGLAQDYPQRGLTIVVPFPPGGASDVLARLLAERMAPRLGQPVVVENRAGAGTVLGTAAVARAAPDGYTLLLTNNALAVNATLRRQLPYDTRADLAPVSYLGMQANILVVAPSHPARTVEDLVRMARANPGTIPIASGGIGGSSHLSLELFKRLAGVDLLHVPFAGGAPAVTAVISGTVAGYFDTVSSSAPYVNEGRLRGLAVTTRERSPILPDVPTLIEAGVPNYDLGNWNAVFVPAGTPPPVIARLSGEIRAVVLTPEVRQRLLSFGIDPQPSTPEFLAGFLDAEIAKWGEVIRAGNIQPE